ncbi:MAG: hypothetical protein JW984_15415 [Deltaproteobacteria bacterium]|uniref:Uncharacterized protein n=1 Tax=Candidatus Zymogenus saltonus TaxID=2844893 RepID=A0A9D8KGF6_9DELT|nr:hypothetical protein [Candidatus Zymogenus saltonus]
MKELLNRVDTRRGFIRLLGKLGLAGGLVNVPGATAAFGIVPGGRFEAGVSYFGGRDPKHVRGDMEDIVKNGCTFVVHTFSEADYHFYTKAMADIVKISHDLGLTVYLDPWGVGGVFGGEAFSRFVVENPAETQRLADGTPLPSACLNRASFRGFLKKWLDKASEIGGDVVFWDEPHFYIPRSVWRKNQGPNEWACRCDLCSSLFKERYGKKMPVVMDKDVIAFRDDSIVSFFKEMTEYAAGLRMKNGLVMLPEENYLTGVSSWDRLASIKDVDIFGTDPYWIIFRKDLEPYVRDAARRVLEISRKYGKEPQIWVQAYKVPAGREWEVVRAVEVIVEEGIRNVAAWSYRGGAPMNLKSDNPDLVWKVLGEAFTKARKGLVGSR